MSDPGTATPSVPPGGAVAVSDAVLAKAVREESGRIVATLTASLRNLDLAEESVADAVLEALREWRVHGVPPKPGAWLTQAARHNALDRLRRDAAYRRKLTLLAETPAPGPGVADERLPLLFGCCHPALGPDAQLALTLRAVCGLTTAQIARATLSSEPTVAQRIVRAKRKIGAAGIPLRIPEGDERVPRLDLVLTVVSVMYNEAHLVAGGDAAADRDVADDAIWLARVLAAALPGEAEAHGLLALLLFHHAREAARAVAGELVLLGAQDRSRWDPALLAAARRELDAAARLHRPGRWQLQAAIAACHAEAPTSADTDWLQVLTLYDLLGAQDRSPIVRLNRAVALAEVAGPAVALDDLATVAEPLAGYHLLHAVRADLLRRLGRADEARDADRTALQLTTNEAEQRLLRHRLALEGDARPARGAARH
ncbi:MAG: RNA polymerase sigma factor [Actinobacteria bacterium]|nr:RNA polymerase sigma factor [Actinomycetota bacterium]